MNNDAVDRLHRQVCQPLKNQFVGRDEVIDLIALAVVAGEHLFLFGPPGTAKSLLVRRFALGVHCPYFEYMLTRFSEPNELFGPVDLARLREGKIATVTTGMLPEAEFAFLDELFNANSAILNNLLTILNERTFRRGAEVHHLPLISAFAASNHLPEEETLQALFDRFLLRARVDSLGREQLPQLLAAGWTLENSTSSGEITADSPTAADLRALGKKTRQVDLAPVMEAYADTVIKIRDIGVALSDRRAIKMLKLVAASAVLANRTLANRSDFWVFRYVWDRAEQIGPLGSLISGIINQEPEAQSPHPRAFGAARVDPEALAQELGQCQNQLPAQQGPALKLVELARLREKVQSISDRAAWVSDEVSRKHLLQSAQVLLDRLR